MNYSNLFSYTNNFNVLYEHYINFIVYSDAVVAGIYCLTTIRGNTVELFYVFF